MSQLAIEYEHAVRRDRGRIGSYHLDAHALVTRAELFVLDRLRIPLDQAERAVVVPTAAGD